MEREEGASRRERGRELRVSCDWLDLKWEGKEKESG